MPSRRPSRRRPRDTSHPPLDLDRALGQMRAESGPDGEWSVRTVRGSEKQYLCPGCNQQIPAGTGHVVVWRNDSWFSAEHALSERRHWHSGCWRARGRRR